MTSLRSSMVRRLRLMTSWMISRTSFCWPNFDVKEENMKVTSRSLGFKLDDIDFDLLPATNLANSDVEGLCFLIELISEMETIQAMIAHSDAQSATRTLLTMLFCS